ncbi:MotE family protein [Azospirillum argentinense]|uniref:MotE family protein n=1 Tax=Azospirillum argentinense TaxID=2970906 RepID=A0ABW8V580_9PROT
MSDATTTAKGAPAAVGGEPKVVIRPAGATPTGVRTSQSVAGQPTAQGAAQAAAQAAAKAKPKAKVKAKAKRKPAVPRRPLSERMREKMKAWRFRILPLTIFVAVLMLGVRVGDLWRITTRDARLPEFPATLAQGQSAVPAAPMQLAANGAKPSPEPAQGGSSNGAPPNPTPPDNAALGPVKNEELLQHFAERRAEIERRTKELEQREALLTAAEKRIDQKVQEMEKVRTDIQKLMRQGDEKQTAQLESLVKIYETMKPKEAARIFEELDMPVLLGVVEKMKETKTAPILAAMDPLKAKELTSALIERRGVPAAPKN